jgi:hypothetical protein
MDVPDPGRVIPAADLLGYLNFSDGRPNPRWQRALDDAFHALEGAADSRSWELLRQWLATQLDRLNAGEASAFRDVSQARAVLSLLFDHVLPAYRTHHRDLLAHLTDSELLTPFFVVRAAEALLTQGGPWDQTERIVKGTLSKLNDYVGHRPIPILETRVISDIYAHEKVRPTPIWLRGAGAAKGKYHDLVTKAIEILQSTNKEVLQDAAFDLNRLDEFALDPRAYDHGHPANRRPNYAFGEWDPHHIDNRGYYRRFVARREILNAMLSRVESPDAGPDPMFESAAALAGTVLMASGICGAGPSFHDSGVTLSKLVPRIARYRDSFYEWLIRTITGPVKEHLRLEAQRLRQPFGGVRQFLNQMMARQRAEQLQESRLAVAFAEMGYAAAARKRVARIPTASVRMLVEIRVRLTDSGHAIARGDLTVARDLLAEAEDYLHRGIACGALPDPWTVIGFQGLYPLFQSREDSIHDSRLDDLMEVMAGLFHSYSHLLAAVASAGEAAMRRHVHERMNGLAQWWDKHATFEVGDLQRVHGGEFTAGAEHVADALAGLVESRRAARPSDLAYWKGLREGFRTPAAFAQVIDALLRQGDRRAAMALLIAWISRAGDVKLEEGEDSFAILSRRWLNSVIASADAGTDRVALVVRFFDLLEANGDELLAAPRLELDEPLNESDDDTFEAAYDDVTYRDTTDDGGQEGVIGGPMGGDFPLEGQEDRLESSLVFLTAVARLWQIAADFLRPHASDASVAEALRGWLRMARSWRTQLNEFLDRLVAMRIPEPATGFEDVMEYDRRRVMRDRLVEEAIATALEADRAARRVGGLLADVVAPSDAQPWETPALHLEAATNRGDPAAVRKLLPEFLQVFKPEPLLFVPLMVGGHPQQIVRARRAQSMLASLLEQIPRLGLIRETFHLLRLARIMEDNSPSATRRVSEFDRMFPIGLSAVLEALLAAAPSWPAKMAAENQLIEIIRRVTDSFLQLWLAHSQTLRLSALESIAGSREWDEIRSFIKTYGDGLFTPQFLALGNLRSVLHRGVANWVESLKLQDDAPTLVADIDEGGIPRERAIRLLDTIIQAVTENHEEYRDYNSTTTQSDYGENLHFLLDFLQLKTQYERYAWRMRPLVQVHAILCRRGRNDLAQRWKTSFTDLTQKLAKQLLDELAKLEQSHSLRLRTVRDRLEERFVRPLDVDRLCAGVADAVREASNQPHTGGAFARLEREIEGIAAMPLGVGLEVPTWLQRFEDELRTARTEPEEKLPDGLAPGVTLPYDELQHQLADWEQPIDGIE